MSTITQHSIPTGTWSVDPVHSHVAFEVAYAGTSTFSGGFREFGGAVADGILTGAATVASVDVKDEQLNGHLQTPDFFDSRRFPEITFRTSDLERGELTIKGVTRSVASGSASPSRRRSTATSSASAGTRPTRAAGTISATTSRSSPISPSSS